MPKRATSNKTTADPKGEKKVTPAAFLKAMAAKKAAAQAAVTAERDVGFLGDEAVMKKLGLDTKGQSITLDAKVSAITTGFAKSDKDKPYFRFAYSLTEDSPTTQSGKGSIVSNYRQLSEEEWQDLETAFARLYGEFEDLGEDPEGWGEDPMKTAVAAAQRLTKEKPDIAVQLSVYEKGSGALGLNVKVVNGGVVDNSDLDDEAEGGEEEGEFKAEEWIGEWVEWTDDEGSLTFMVKGWDANSDTFYGEDEESNEVTDAPVDQCEWLDPEEG